MEQRNNHTILIAVVTGLIALLLGLCLGALLGGLGVYTMSRGSANVGGVERIQRAPAAPTVEAQPVIPSDGRGVVVQEVVAGSPAEAAGLQPGDVITEFDGAQLDANHNLAALVSRHQPGDRVEVRIIRNGSERVLTVELGARADDNAAPYLGVRYAPTPQP